MNLGNFLAELKRRNVYKVAVAYLVASWALAQGLAQVLPVFDIPNWIVRLLVLLLILGFPVALIMSWAFEITPEGVQRTREVDPAVSIRRQTGRRLVAGTVILAVIATGFLMFRLARRERPTVASIVGESIPEKSVAVLPFDNLSEEKGNGYFAEGIQDEIITRLAKVADLKVISRTSTLHYKSSPPNLLEIGKQLRVAHIVEGSVQKSGETVRVNVQLLRASNDSHLWAETFDRKLTDIFSVESEVAKAIADQLQARLTGQEEKVITAKLTDNLAAYDAYLRGLAVTVRTSFSPEREVEARAQLKEAVRLDPHFARGWALLSQIDSLGYVTTFLPPTVSIREEARQAAETALTLQPDLGEAILSEGLYLYACLKDYDGAERYFSKARERLPNSSRIPELLAYVYRRRGQWDKSELYFGEAERVNPRDANLLAQHAFSAIHRRLFNQANQILDQILDIDPDDLDTVATKAAIAQAEGNLPHAADLLLPIGWPANKPIVIERQAYQAILEHRPDRVVSKLREIVLHPDPALGYFNGELRFWLGWVECLSGEQEVGQESWRRARTELEVFLKDQPENHFVVGDLALINAGLGDREAASRLTELCLTFNPVEKDALAGPRSLEIDARVAALLGDPDRALNALKKLFSAPQSGFLDRSLPFTPALLRFDPMFDPIRNDPRFAQLADG